MATKTTPAQRVYERLRAARDEHGIAAIANKDVAVLIRTHLKRTFPETKFSVRCSRGDAIHVDWTDGPPQGMVEREIGQFSFGGFDGMIDMAYRSDNWLLPDGTMAGAYSSGTEGSRGVVSGYATDCPAPGAVLVKYGPKYVFAQKEFSPARMRELVEAVAAHYGIKVRHNLPYWSQHHNGDSLTVLAWQWDRRQYEEATPCNSPE